MGANTTNGVYRTLVTLHCIECGLSFEVPKHDKHRRKLCSSKCNLRRLHRNNLGSALIDGKFYMNRNGYLCKLGSESIPYHIEVIERALGRKLIDNESTHHIDLDKTNNSLKNLVVLTKSKHQRLHGQLNHIVSALCKLGIVKFDLIKEEYYVDMENADG